MQIMVAKESFVSPYLQIESNAPARGKPTVKSVLKFTTIQVHLFQNAIKLKYIVNLGP